MIVMEGMMLVPPERGTILGRALWKPRYVVFGTGAPMKSQNDILAQSSRRSSSTRKGLSSTSSRPSLVDVSRAEPEQDGLYISIYKTKGDWEYLAQHNLSAFKSCEIRALAHRKGGPTLPTLMLELKPDLLSDKARKRRSSRTSGLTAKDPWANILLFRTIPDERHNIYDWHQQVKPNLTPDSPHGSFITPAPQYTNFSNPFASRENSVRRPDPHMRKPERQTSTYPHAPKERPSAIISPSPSLRSRRSDLSSQASSQHPQIGFSATHAQPYSPALPNDLPSPASTSYEPQFIEGWAATQGRTSALSSHTRGSNSIASAVAPSIAPNASTPPGPRETILDRAFQMRCIPGSERISENDEDQLSSLARFEALMREADEQKLEKDEASPDGEIKEVSEWNLDSSSSEYSDGSEPQIDNEDDSDEVEGLEFSDDDEVGIPAQAQQIEYISGRRTPIPGRRPLSPAPNSPPVPYINPQAMFAFHGETVRSHSPTGLRPRTGTNPSPLSMNQDNRFHPFTPTRSMSANTVPLSKESTSTFRPALVDVVREEKRPRDSVKRLSFQEFTRRLSSTSSLLLVQTNVSSSANSGHESGRASFDAGQEAVDRNGVNGDRIDGLKDKNCGWRGSVGVFGEGGFL